ncbi:hypothetical protein NX059_009881 [Plenodomus lindquistii]|nr:hypothetical protein NX059_009881 [Plenodomus lindquistii]
MVRSTLALALSCAPGFALAWFRSQSNVSVLDEPYATYGPTINLTTSMTTGVGAPAQSFWYTAYIKATNGHNYFTCSCLSGSATPGSMNSYISLLDVDTGEYYGRNNLVQANFTNRTYDADSGTLRQWSSSPDLVSLQHVDSTDPRAMYNLTFEPRGPNLYHGGSGIHYWGTGTTTQIAYPQLWVTGTITLANGTKTEVIPEESVGWMDRQWGEGYASNGWFFYTIFLPNGMSFAAWRTGAVDSNPKRSSFATVLFPDGHQEVHVLEPDVHESDPWVSADTNLTYYASFQLNIPTLKLSANLTLPYKNTGEMATLENPAAITTLFEAYADVVATIDGHELPVPGFGLVETIFPSAPEF